MINNKVNPAKRKHLTNIINDFVTNTECKNCNIKLICNAAQELDRTNICIMITEAALGKGKF